MNKPSAAGAPRAAKKLSRRAVLRYARANLAAGEAHRAGPILADAPEPAAVSNEVAAAIAAYQPEKKHRGSWAELAELTRRLTLGYAPPSPGNAGSTATHVSAFLRWFRAWPGRADVNAPWTPGSCSRPARWRPTRRSRPAHPGPVPPSAPSCVARCVP